MAIGPALLSLFGGRAAPTDQINPATAPQQVVPAAPATASTIAGQQAAAAANPTVPSATTPVSNGSATGIPAAGEGAASPLDNFKELWKADAKTPASPSLVPNFNLDPQGLRTAAEKINFTQHIPEDLLTKASQGDAAALRDVVNKAAQIGFANAAAASGELIKQSLGSAQGILKDQVLPAAYRDQQISQALTESNPVFSDPAVAPMLSMLKDRFAATYPTASPAEIAAHATAYLGGLSSKIVGAQGGRIVSTQEQTAARGGFSAPKDTDWTNFFGVS